MNDIVIPYLKNNSGEIDACIALIERNVPHRNIYVVEDYEKSLHSEISHINQILKLKWAIENLDLTDNFYLFNDDFFVLDRVDKIPYYQRGTLGEQVNNRRGAGSYKNALVTTRNYLFDGALSYELHIPFLFDKKQLYKLISDLQPFIDRGKCPLIRSTYGNEYQVGGEYMVDVKNIKDFEGKTYISTTESSFKRDIGDYIRSKI